MNDLNPELFSADDFVRYFTPTSRIEELMLEIIKEYCVVSPEGVDGVCNYQSQISDLEERLCRAEDDADQYERLLDKSTQENERLSDMISDLEQDIKYLNDQIEPR